VPFTELPWEKTRVIGVGGFFGLGGWGFLLWGVLLAGD